MSPPERMYEVWVQRPHDPEPWLWSGHANQKEAWDDFEQTRGAHPDWRVEFRNPPPGSSS